MRKPPRLRHVTAALCLLALNGCGSAPAAPSADQQQVLLFDEAYKSIAKYYLEPVTARDLAVAGLQNLASVDASLSVQWQGNFVVLHQGEHTLRFATPAPSDAAAWASLTQEIAAAAQARSRALAALSTDRLEETLLDGSMTVLDRFSHYAPPDVAEERRAARDGFGGIGVTLNSDGPDVRIVEVLPETPAAAAGLRVDDRILAIDGIEVSALNREDVAQRLRGPADSVVALEIARAGVDISFSMHRARIVPPSVVLTEDHGIAILRVSSFNQETGDNLAELLRQAHRDLGGDMRGIILDLRGNPGGLLDQSIEVASLFLDGQPISSTVGRVPESVQSFTAPHRTVETLPLAVLINGGSASASEIVASALQDTGRAVVVGTSSYGKGTVQNVQRMPNDGELTITWARLVTPGGYILHKHGVVPTVCTAKLPDDADGIAAALSRSGGSLRAQLEEPRAKLDDAGWQQLRDLCPGAHEDHRIELETAEKVLSDRALYADALIPVPARTPAPVATAGVVR
ncbi:MAG TPA: S41 family peptidase [Stellaceae bacterium]|nr:S41 family peptidase [Stellaceae bacterium]